MSEDLKSIARRTLEEIFPARDVVGRAQVTDENVVSHGARPDEPGGMEGVQRTMFWLAHVFSDQRWAIHQLIEGG